MRLVLRSRAWTPQTGLEALAREVGEVREPIGREGTRRVRSDSGARGAVARGRDDRDSQRAHACAFCAWMG